MNPYEKLDHEKRTWDLKETAAFLGYSCKYFYTLVQKGMLDGCFMKLNGDYRFCPAKIKEWMEKSFKNGGLPPEPPDNSDKDQGKEGGDEAALSAG